MRCRPPDDSQEGESLVFRLIDDVSGQFLAMYQMYTRSRCSKVFIGTHVDPELTIRKPPCSIVMLTSCYCQGPSLNMCAVSEVVLGDELNRCRRPIQLMQDK